MEYGFLNDIWKLALKDIILILILYEPLHIIIVVINEFQIGSKLCHPCIVSGVSLFCLFRRFCLKRVESVALRSYVTFYSGNETVRRLQKRFHCILNFDFFMNLKVC